jgi:hypothetical protein
MSAAAPAIALVVLTLLVVGVVLLKGLRESSEYWDRAARERRERRHLQGELTKAKLEALRRGERVLDDVSDDASGRPPLERREGDHHPEH